MESLATETPYLDLGKLSTEQKRELLLLLEEKARRKRFNRIRDYYPEEGRLSRHAYPKHMSFFRAGSKYRERLMIAANRVGKSEGVGGIEVTYHLTGEYPDWWTGRRFNRPINIWAAGDTAKTVRDIIQKKLLGDEHGTGLIPKNNIVRTTMKAGVPDAIDQVWVKHKNGGNSVLTFKSYDQKRKSFQGTEMDVIWLDEEPPADIYSECLLRTMTTDGLLLLTFTPLLGISEVVMMFMPEGRVPTDEEMQRAGRFVVNATWDDAPHLTTEQKEALWAGIPVHQRDARARGIPMLGSGAIYPITEDQIVVDDFDLSNFTWWRKCFALDVGWNNTAALWGATNPDTDVTYLYSEYKQGMEKPPIHALALKLRGEWIPGVIDPAARGRTQDDGRQLLAQYRGLGLDLVPANNAVEAGIFETWTALSTGKLKIFRSLIQTLGEIRVYRRDENGKIVKTNDHLMDCMRYLVMSGLHRAISLAEIEEEYERLAHNQYGSWGQGKSAVTGY